MCTKKVREAKTEVPTTFKPYNLGFQRSSMCKGPVVRCKPVEGA
jgi:hypothetical protein